jgi:glyceraldehyde 3-phosphate dehydrogenase
MIRIGINGFGRIGRAIFRINETNPLFEVVAINDIDPNVENHAYLLKYDTIYGRFDGHISSDNGNMKMVVNDKAIQFYDKEKINEVPWEKHNVDIVIDASGTYQNVIQSESVIKKRAVKKVIITHSPKDGVDHTIIFGVNESTYDSTIHNTVSTSICDSNASGPVLKLLDDEFGIDYGYITTLHPWLSYQNLVDGSLRSVSSPGHFWKDFSLGRSSTESLIPKSTTLVGALKKVIPEISGNLDAISFRIPTAIVSSSDLTITLKKAVTISDLNDFFKRKSMENDSVTGYQEDQLVSIDFKGICESVFVDGRWTRVLKDKTVKLVLWYDNEWGYSHRVCDMVNLMAENF